jgi:hypothetical protein
MPSSPDDRMSIPPSGDEPQASSSAAARDFLEVDNDAIHPKADVASVHSNDDFAGPDTLGSILEADFEPTLHTRLLNHKNWDAASGCGSENCNHGAMSPRPITHRSTRSYGSIASGPGTSVDPAHAILGDAVAGTLRPSRSGGKKSTTQLLAKRHGIRHSKKM